MCCSPHAAAAAADSSGIDTAVISLLFSFFTIISVRLVVFYLRFTHSRRRRSAPTGPIPNNTKRQCRRDYFHHKFFWRAEAPSAAALLGTPSPDIIAVSEGKT